VKTVMNLRVPYNVGKCLSDWVTGRLAAPEVGLGSMELDKAKVRAEFVVVPASSGRSSQR
jgi:hypothetical protein